ncbi:hypothetical protein QOZ83_16270 [Romboutsia sedimentorum]|uniref:hypothetical protein n=1 Tax=Romboutsia sedimentorum TaxID=1368474 RepID=UPI0024DECBD8|nr:hypothetical protein [Romboutsia sedimentorum]MDK2587401.1 hypothetical protein [Romboutsia sedimentorum]
MYNNCMLKQTTIQIDYTTYGDNYQFKLPLNSDYIIPKDDSVRLLSQIGLNPIW